MNADQRLKAGETSLDAILMAGVPAGEVLGDLMFQLDQQLSENQTQLEQCLKEITDYEHELCHGTSQQCAVNAVDALKKISDFHLIEKHSCYDVSMECVQQMLKQLLKMLESVPDSEDAVLKIILDLASVEGLRLPECSQAVETGTSSLLSLHTAIDTAEQAVDATWNQLCVLLRRRFLERLKQVSDGCGTTSERRHLVTSLCVLSPRTVVASQYCSIRHLQLDACIDQFLYPQGDQERNFQAWSEGFKCAVDKILVMMSDDFDLLVTGCLMEDVDEAFQFLGDVYFDRLQDEIGLLADKMTSELPGSTAAGGSRPDKTAKFDETTVAKSPSEYGILGHRVGAGNSRRTQSHDGGNAPFVGTKRHPLTVVHDFTNLHGVDPWMFDMIVNIVDTLLTLDCRIDTWRSIMSSSWRRAIDVGRNKKLRWCLKSALKSREDVVPELHLDAKKSHKTTFGIRCECLHKSDHPVCTGDKQKPQTQSCTSSGNERAPLLKGLYRSTIFVIPVPF